MGALLSLPFMAMPGIGTLWGIGASCCGAATCSAVFSSCGKCGNSIATRIAYALILLINSIVSWIMLTDWAMKKLSHLTLDYVDIKCHGEQCYGYVAVQRINFALGFFHILMALMLVGVRNSKDGRAPIQNGFWGPKVIAWVGMIVLTFFIPNSFFIVWGNYIAMIGACLFLLIGLILLVDLAHNWAEYCQEKIEVTESRVWTGLLVGSALSMYLASFAMTIVMYIYFAKSGCGMNQAAITVCTALPFSIHPYLHPC
jgi:serine incorporator 1/3